MSVSFPRATSARGASAAGPADLRRDVLGSTVRLPMAQAGKRRTAATGPGAPGGPPRGRCYAGIGSRLAPAPVLARMRELARGYARAGWTLRTGGSPGAD